MIHTILFITKIIGICLLAILSLAIILILFVLFIPIRYEIYGAYNKEKSIKDFKARFHWFFYLISGQAKYHDGDFRAEIKVFGFKLKKPCKKQKAPTKKTTKKAEKKGGKKKYTFRGICDKIKKIRTKKDTVITFLSDSAHKKAFQILKKELMHVLRYLRPKKLEGSLCFGFEDPYLTGKLLAILSVLYPWYGDSVMIQPDFENEVFECNLGAKGSIRGINLLVFLLRVFINESVMKTYKDIKRLGL